jgi:signal transduction histidine kinase
MLRPKGATERRGDGSKRKLWEDHGYAQAIVDTVRGPVLVLDADLRVRSANRSFYQTFQVSPEDTENCPIYELGDGQWDIPQLRELLENVLPRDSVFEDFEVDHEFLIIGHKTMLLNARRLCQDDVPSEFILLAIEDVTERKRAENEREALKDREALQKRVVELDAFAYTVTHELKEPLRTIEAFSRFILDDCGEQLDEQGRQYLERLSNASTRMKRLIEDLLKLSRVSREKTSRTRIDVGRLVGQIVEGMTLLTDTRDATVEVEDGLPDILADEPRIEQIFTNLIGNAIKFNASKRPFIKVGFRGVEGSMAAFYVQDNGIGIDPQYHGRIFGLFQRLHSREEYEGTGAGLAIVKRVVETLGGRIWVESKVGAGSTFFVSLPLWTEEVASSEGEAA